jgi:hypothetical protein
MTAVNAMPTKSVQHASSNHRRGRVTPAGALVMSCSALAVFSLLVAAVAAYSGNDSLRDVDNRAFLDAVVDEQRLEALVLVRSIPETAPGGSEYRLGVLDLAQPKAPPRLLAQQWIPTTLQKTAHGIFVGDQGGAIWRLDDNLESGDDTIVCRHPLGDPVMELSCSADGRRLMSRGLHTLYFWDLPEGKLTHQWQLDLPGFAALTPDGEAVYCSQGGTVLEIQAKSGEVLREIAVHDHVAALVVSANGRRLATLANDRQLRVYALPGGELLWERACLGYEGHELRAVILSPALTFSESGWLACGYSDQNNASTTMALWDAETGTLAGRYQGHRNRVLGAAFAGEQRLHSWDADGAWFSWALPARADQSTNDNIGGKVTQ